MRAGGRHRRRALRAPAAATRAAGGWTRSLAPGQEPRADGDRGRRRGRCSAALPGRPALRPGRRRLRLADRRSRAHELFSCWRPPGPGLRGARDRVRGPGEAPAPSPLVDNARRAHGAPRCGQRVDESRRRPPRPTGRTSDSRCPAPARGRRVDRGAPSSDPRRFLTRRGRMVGGDAQAVLGDGVRLRGGPDRRGGGAHPVLRRRRRRAPGHLVRQHDSHEGRGARRARGPGCREFPRGATPAGKLGRLAPAVAALRGGRVRPGRDGAVHRRLADVVAPRE